MAQQMTRAPIYQQAVRPVRLLWALQVISRLKPVPLIDRVLPGVQANLDCRTGFSREGVGCHAAELMVLMRASSRLKPVLRDRVHPMGSANLDCMPGFSQEGAGGHAAELMALTLASSRL